MEFGPTIPARTAPQARERRPLASCCANAAPRGNPNNPECAAGKGTPTSGRHRCAKRSERRVPRSRPDDAERRGPGREANHPELGVLPCRPPEAGETRTPDASWVPNRVLLMRLRGGICSPARHQHADRAPRSPLLLVHQRHRRSSMPRRISLSPAGAPEAAPRRPRRAAPCQLRSDGRPGRAS